jgi:hypothetical protein
MAVLSQLPFKTRIKTNNNFKDKEMMFLKVKMSKMSLLKWINLPLAS